MDNIHHLENGRGIKGTLGRSGTLIKPLGVCNTQTAYDRELLSGKPKSPTGAKKSLFGARTKENYSFSLCKEISGNQEKTGRSPSFIVPHTIKTANSFDDSKQNKRIKPRRSMLGQRGKILLPSFVSDDPFTLSKPLHSSSPTSNNRVELTTSNNVKSASTHEFEETVYPFDSQDSDTSSFFSNGISQSTWSVFKIPKKTDGTAYHPLETPVSRAPSTSTSRGYNAFNKSNILSSDQESKAKKCIVPKYLQKESQVSVDLKLLAPKSPQNEAVISRWLENAGKLMSTNETKSKSKGLSQEQKSKLKSLSQQFQNQDSNDGATQSKVENYLNSYSPNEPLMYIECNADEERVQSHTDKKNNYLKPCLEAPEIELNDISIPFEPNSTQESSDDSYLKNETIILGTCKKSLHEIVKESNSIMYKSEERDSDTEDTGDETVLSDLNADIPMCDNITNLIQNLKEERENFAKMFESHLSFVDNKLSELTSAWEVHKSNNLKCRNTVKGKRKKVVSSKIKSTVGRTPKPQSSSNTYSDLRAIFTSLKTPDESNRKLRRLRKSVCYTPNSLSVLVGDQVKDIFGDT